MSQRAGGPGPDLPLRHLLSVADLGRDGVEEVLALTESFAEVSARAIPQVPALRGRTIATVFFEDSTRTRLSFEAAARRLSAGTMAFSASGSSVSKGESLRDTAQTLQAMGADLLVVRHPSAGAAAQVSRWAAVPVVNAGDGAHEHPTQALLDCYTILEARRDRGLPRGGAGAGGINGSANGALAGLRIGIVGDVSHSRVARSCAIAFNLLGAEVLLVAPPTLLPPVAAGLLPPGSAGSPIEVSHDLDELIGSLDVVYMLRVQHERLGEVLLPSLREYTARYGLTAKRASRLSEGALVLHPGPMNRGVEIAGDIADSEICLVTEQVANGVAVRMAVLFILLGSAVGAGRG
ncbi:MAG: aspartate carbamoyltransferase catalytic subunit [Acidimicrobiales bacterium]